MKGMKIHIKQLKPDLPLSSLSTNLINFNSYKHQSVLRIEERIELSYPPNEKKAQSLNSRSISNRQTVGETVGEIEAPRSIQR